MNAQTPHAPPHRRYRSGFSLAEVAIAVAIAALGLVTVLGLVPAGLEDLRKAGETVAISRIYQQMINEVQQADWGKESPWPGLEAFDDVLRYYDNEGTPITTSTSNFNFKLSYVAKFQVEKDEVLLSGDNAGAGATDQRVDMRRIRVQIATTTTPAFNFNTAVVGRNFEWRAFNVTRQF